MHLFEEQGLDDGSIGRDPRLAIHLNVVVQRPGKRPKGCHATNVSFGGMFLALPVGSRSTDPNELTQAEFKPGDEIDILCSIKTTEGRVDLKLPSRVRHFRDNGIGVAFIQRRPEITHLLKGYIESLRASQSEEGVVSSAEPENLIDSDVSGVSVIDEKINEADEHTLDLQAIPHNQDRYHRWRYTAYIACGIAILLLSTAVAVFYLTKQSLVEQGLAIRDVVNSVHLVKQELADQRQLFSLSMDELSDANLEAKANVSIHTEIQEIQAKLNGLVRQVAEIDLSNQAMSDSGEQSTNASKSNANPPTENGSLSKEKSQKSSVADSIAEKPIATSTGTTRRHLGDNDKKVQQGQSVIDRTGDIYLNMDSTSMHETLPGKKKPVLESTVARTVAKGLWTINLVALRNKANAQRLVEKGAALGISVTSQESSGNEGPFWRLSVQGFPTIEAAKEAAPGIAKQLGLTETWINRH